MRWGAALALASTVGFMVGLLVASTPANANASAAVCLGFGITMSPKEAVNTAEKLVNEHLAAGRTNLLSTAGDTVICAW